MKFRPFFTLLTAVGLLLAACGTSQPAEETPTIEEGDTVATLVQATVQAATDEAIAAMGEDAAIATLVEATLQAAATDAPAATDTQPPPADTEAPPTETETPATEAPADETGTPEGDVTPESEPARVEIRLGYPSEGIPALQVTIQDFSNGRYYYVYTVVNQSSAVFTEVEPGTYVAYAHTRDGGLAGGYTYAVPCGLAATCTNHTLIPFEVTSGSTITGIEIKDWYAPPGTFPAPPS